MGWISIPNHLTGYVISYTNFLQLPDTQDPPLLRRTLNGLAQILGPVSLSAYLPIFTRMGTLFPGTPSSCNHESQVANSAHEFPNVARVYVEDCRATIKPDKPESDPVRPQIVSLEVLLPTAVWGDKQSGVHQSLQALGYGLVKTSTVREGEEIKLFERTG